MEIGGLHRGSGHVLLQVAEVLEQSGRGGGGKDGSFTLKMPHGQVISRHSDGSDTQNVLRGEVGGGASVFFVCWKLAGIGSRNEGEMADVRDYGRE